MASKLLFKYIHDLNKWMIMLCKLALVLSLGLMLVSFNSAQADQCDGYSDLVEKSDIYFSSVINSGSIKRLMRKIDKVIKNSEGPIEITISLSSNGGEMAHAIKAIRQIRLLNKNPLITINTRVSRWDTCESSCTLLFTAGEKRIASPSSDFGFHSPKFERGNLNGRSRKEIVEEYRQLWISLIGVIDKKAAQRIEEGHYLAHSDMRYLSGRELATGYVTDLD